MYNHIHTEGRFLRGYGIARFSLPAGALGLRFLTFLFVSFLSISQWFSRALEIEWHGRAGCSFLAVF